VLADPKSIAFGPDGSVFIGDSGDRDYRVRRVGPNGIITLYAGMAYPGVPSAGSSDSTGRATTIMLGGVDALTVDADGNLFIAETGGHRIRQVTRNGLMSTLFKGSTADFWPADLEFGPDGALYISSKGGHMGVYRRHPDGTIALAAGRTEGGWGSVGGYATATDLRLLSTFRGARA
jgi:sugar lactone lactonase YvrE